MKIRAWFYASAYLFLASAIYLLDKSLISFAIVGGLACCVIGMIEEMLDYE